METGIYKIYCNSNGKLYVGSSQHIPTRWTQHKNHLRQQIHECKHLQHAWDKYGGSSFEFSVIEHIDKSQLLEREQYWLDSFDWSQLFNSSKMAGRPSGWHGPHSKETREKIARAHAGKPKSIEHRLSLSEAQMGNKNALGSKYSEEILAKLSSLRKGRKLTEDHKRKISEGNKGKSRNKGKIVSLETRQKISMAMKNRIAKPRSEETKKKMSNAMKNKPWTEARRLAQKVRSDEFIHQENT